MRTLIGYLCLALLPTLAAGPALAQDPAGEYSRDDYLALIEQYVDRMVNIYDGSWAYSYTSHDRIDGESLSRRVDPSKPFLESEVIIAENGGPPSAQAQARQERRMQRRQKREFGADRGRAMVEEERAREGSEKERFLNLLIRDSLRLVARDGDLHTLEFRGMEEDRAKIYEHLLGTLVLDTGNGFIRELRVRVTQPFSPYLFMRIDNGYFSLRFDLRDGVPVQTDATWQLEGDILYVMDLDRDRNIQWFDLSRVLPDPAS